MNTLPEPSPESFQ